MERREWTITVEVVTPPPDDAPAHARILTLADAVRDDARVAALTLTDRTASPAADPVALAPTVAARAAKAPLVHLAGKGCAAADVERALARCAGQGIASVLLTGGDLAPGESVDALAMLRLARAATPGLMRFAVLTVPRSLRGAVSWERAAAKRDAGAQALVAQVTWDLAEREIVAAWQARLGAPILGAAMLLTRGRVSFLAAHRITGIDVPAALRARLVTDDAAAARRRLALDLVLLRRLGYAGAHVSGILTPSLLAGVLAESERLDAALGQEWRDVWRDAVGIA